MIDDKHLEILMKFNKLCHDIKCKLIELKGQNNGVDVFLPMYHRWWESFPYQDVVNNRYEGDKPWLRDPIVSLLSQ